MLVPGWLLGVTVLTVRLLSGWIWVQRMKSRGTRVAARELQAAVVRLSKRLHIARSVRLLESARVDVPTVIGWLKPVILRRCQRWPVSRRRRSKRSWRTSSHTFAGTTTW